jgi:hypothetical protein
MELLFNYEEVSKALAEWNESTNKQKDLVKLDEIFEKCSGASVQLELFKELTLANQRYIWTGLTERMKGSLWFLMDESYRWYVLIELICNVLTAKIIWETRKTVKQPLCQTDDLSEVVSMIYV